MQIAFNDLKIETVERRILRSEFFVADECFLTGTAAHVTPVLEVDGRLIGTGEIGPITARLQEKYFEIVRGVDRKYADWLTPVIEKAVGAGSIA